MKFGGTTVFLSVLFVLFSGGLLHSQTAAELDELLESREITWGQACRFVLPASGVLEARSSAGAAFALARQNGWLPKGAAAGGPVTLGGLSFLITESFDIKGSVLYALFPGPRYAYRQLDYLGMLPGLRDPALKVSGERLAQILGRVLDYRGDGEPAAPPELPPEERIQEQGEQIAEEIREEPEGAGEPAAAAEPAAPPELPPEEKIQEQGEQLAEEIREEPETGRAEEEEAAVSLENIQFLPDDMELTETERIKLIGVAAILSRYPGRKILVEGHTALAGTEAGRLEVSTQRAQAVADFLVLLGSRKPEDILVRGCGAERPLGDNGTAAGQALNRRVEITILDE